MIVENAFNKKSSNGDVDYMVKILDFGISKLTVENPKFDVEGTPMWIAPEQAKGHLT